MVNQTLTNAFSDIKILSFVTIAVVVLLVVDGIIINLPIYDIKTQKSQEISLLFGGQVIVLAVSQIIYLRTIKRRADLNRVIGKYRKYADITHNVVSVAQYFIIALLLATFLQLEILKQYDATAVKILVLTSTLLSFLILTLLVFRYFRWLRIKLDFLIIAYTIATILIAMNSLFIGLFIWLELEDIPNIIRSSRMAVSDSEVRNLELKKFQSNLSLFSFISLWAASSFLLRQNRRRLGRFKFYTIVILPLVYYFGVIQLTLSYAFSYYQILSPVQTYTFNTINSILTRPVGGMLFGIAFWIIARNIENKNISDYMKFSAFGIILISMSNVGAGLYLLPYPPFGLPTISFIGIASYLLFVGIYYSAISVSLDSTLRTSIEKSVEQQFRFVSKIGSYEMQQEIENRVKATTRGIATRFEQDSGVETKMTPSDIEEYIKTVIKEKEKVPSTKDESFNKGVSDQ
jgi:hypothetical protein